MEPFGFGMQHMGWGVGSGIISLGIIFVLWSIVWKGLALWHSARRGDTYWFIALLVINTMGILEIIYLFAFAKLKGDELFAIPERKVEAENVTNITK